MIHPSFHVAARSARPALWALLSLASINALAQSTAPAPAAGDRVSADVDGEVVLEKFVVTGSAVPTLGGAATFQRVTTLLPSQAEDAGAATTVEWLRTMPDFFGNMATEQRSNGGTGSAGVNLRGLAGTLTLLDGHRTAGFDEINTIPLIAVQRIEVVKDGAGARYGADALTGVFNTILVPRYVGQKMEAYYGNTTDEDAGVLRLAIMTGAANARTDIVVAAEYYHRNALMSRDREVSASEDGRSQGGRFVNSSVFSGETIGRTATTSNAYWMLAPGLNVATSAADLVPLATTGYYNARAYTTSVPEQENKSAYVRINHKIVGGGILDAYARFLYSHNEYQGGVSPIGIQQNLGTVLSPHVPTGFFLFSAPSSYVYTLRPSVLGPRGRIFERDTYDFHFGLKGRIGENWSWDATYVYSWWYRDETQTNSISIAKLSAAVANGSFNPFAMDFMRGVNPNNNRLYDNPLALADAAATGRVDFDFGVRGGDVRVNGSVFELPGGRIEVAGGVDYYTVEQSTVPDGVLSATGPYLGFNGSSFSSSGYESRGAYFETVVPIVQSSQKIPALRSLKLSGSLRRSEKDIAGTVRTSTGGITMREREFKENTPRLGLLYEPCDEVLVRGMYAEGFRTPSLTGLFNGPSNSQPSLIDPLGFSTAGATVTSQGNPDLEPEGSKTWSGGVVLTPKRVRGLTVRVDYYDQTVRNLVAEGAQYILNQNGATQGSGYVRGNVATINPAADFASRITRSATGAVTGVSSSQMNVARREATGVEYEVVFTRLTEVAKFTSRVAWNTTLSWDLVPSEGSPSQNWLGRYVDATTNSISPGSIPRHRGRVVQGVEKGSWSFVGALNHVSQLEDDWRNTDGGVFRYVSAWTTYDAQVGYKWKSAGLEFRVGMNNLFDKEAPFAAAAHNTSSNDSYDVTLHSSRGRFAYVQVRKTF